MKKITSLSFRSLFYLALAPLPLFGADYPENRDYGDLGDFVVKRGVEFGRTADLFPIGPVLINLPEGPGSSATNLPEVRYEDTAWDLSDLTNPTMIRSLTCDTCFPGQPIHAHATVVRFYDGEAFLYGRNAGDLVFDPNGATSNEQLIARDDFWSWGYEPITYLHLTAPYYVRTYWDYGFDPSGQFAIRDSSQFLPSGPFESWSVRGTDWEPIFGETELGVWLGEPYVYWDHLQVAGVTGFSSWLGNHLVVASDQQSTGVAIYDVEGFQHGRIPRLISTYKPTITEPDGNQTGIGGYWVESYGTNKLVFAARQRSDLIPSRHYSSLFIVDISDPTNPHLTCELFFDQDRQSPLDGDDSSDPMYVNFQDQYAYVDHFQVDIPGCEAAYSNDQHISNSEFANIVYKFKDIANQCDASQYFRPLGQVGLFGGYDWWVTSDVNEQGMCFFVTQDEPDTRPPFVAGHTPVDGQQDYPIDGLIHVHIPETLRTETVVNAVSLTIQPSDDPVPFRHQLSHTGIISIWPNENLQPHTQYRVALSGIQDFMGNTMAPFSFTFTTDDGVLTGPDGSGGPNEVVPSYTGTPFYPKQSSQLACQPESTDGDVWVVNPDNDSVAIVTPNRDSESMQVSPTLVREIKLNYEAPTSVTQIASYFAVTHRDDDKVVFYDDAGYPQFSIDTGHGTQPISSVSDDSYLYVALYGSGEVIKISPSERSILTRIQVGPTPKAMALHENRLLVTRFISPTENGEVYDIDTNGNMALTRTIMINKVLVGDDIDHGSGVPNYLSSIVITADGTQAYVTATKANTDRGTRHTNTQPLPLDDDNTVRPMMAIIDLINNQDANTDPLTRQNTIDFDNRADPSSVTFLVDPAIRVHTLQGNNIAVANNLSQNQSTQFRTDLAPQSSCATLRTLYVKNFTSRTLSAIDVAGFMHDGRLAQNVSNIATVTEEKLSPTELAGLQEFYHSDTPEMGPEGYMTCASCHFGGGHDGRVWDITNMGEGLRNTPSLNGASGTRFGLLHWSANFDEVQDFEIQIEQLNGGEGLIPGLTFSGQTPLELTTTDQSDRLDALAAYVNGLGQDTVKRSPYRTYNGELTPAALRGLQIYQQDNCDTCHTGLAYRDGLTHDVGTITTTSGNRLNGPLTAIRTPSLIELWDSAPYFHDGSAQTLAEVLERGDHARDYSPEQLSDLQAFLFSIDRELYIEDEVTQ